MKNTIHILMLLIIIVAVCNSSSRMKRRVVFRKNSKFFLRLNGKEPVLPFTTIFQHGWGFRMNWPLPDTIPGIHKIFRRDVGRDIQNILKQPELESYICVLKHFSNVIINMEFTDYCGVLCNIANIVKRSQGQDLKFYSSILNHLQDFNGSCTNFDYELSPYTDI